MNPRRLQQYLWGDFYYHGKKIYKKPQTANGKEMFIQFVMDPLVKEYNKLFTYDLQSSSA